MFDFATGCLTLGSMTLPSKVWLGTARTRSTLKQRKSLKGSHKRGTGTISWSEGTHKGSSHEQSWSFAAVLWIRTGVTGNPDPAFYLNGDPYWDPVSQINADPDKLSEKVEFLHENIL